MLIVDGIMLTTASSGTGLGWQLHMPMRGEDAELSPINGCRNIIETRTVAASRARHFPCRVSQLSARITRTFAGVQPYQSALNRAHGALQYRQHSSHRMTTRGSQTGTQIGNISAYPGAQPDSRMRSHDARFGTSPDTRRDAMVLAYKTPRIAALHGTLREAKYHQGARLMPC